MRRSLSRLLGWTEPTSQSDQALSFLHNELMPTFNGKAVSSKSCLCMKSRQCYLKHSMRGVNADLRISLKVHGSDKHASTTTFSSRAII